MGLAITRRIVDDYHDSRIILENTDVGKGSTFLIYLPVAPPEETEQMKSTT